MTNASLSSLTPARRRRIAFLTMDSLDGFVAYDHLAVVPLNQLGWDVAEISWHDKNVAWDDFTAVVIRSPWDYHHHIEEFLNLLGHIESSDAKLLNPLDVVRWNVDKTYLRELHANGVRIVPTAWMSSPSRDDLEGVLQSFRCDELVIKPTIGAGARDTFRWRRDRPTSLTDHVFKSFHYRPAMIQPFLSSIVEIGEWSLFYFGGQYSHTVLKTPKRGDFRVQEEYGSRLRSIKPTPDQMQLAETALRTVRTDLLYARVDLVELPGGEPAIIELELIEPSLYFPYDDQSPKRFARALDDMLARA